MMAQQFLALSLFIILLSFFIVLTALSDYNDTKSQPVLASLELAFKGRASGHEQSPAQPQREDEQEQKGDTLDKIKAHFTGQIKALDIQKNRLGTHMYVRIPLSEFETLLTSAAATGISQKNVVMGQGGAFVPTLVSLMDSEESGIPYRMDMTLETESDPATMQNETPQILARDLKKVAEFTETLERAGMPVKRISASVAVAKGQGGEQQPVRHVELLFRRYVPLDPTAGKTLEEVGGGNG